MSRLVSSNQEPQAFFWSFNIKSFYFHFFLFFHFGPKYLLCNIIFFSKDHSMSIISSKYENGLSIPIPSLFSMSIPMRKKKPPTKHSTTF